MLDKIPYMQELEALNLPRDEYCFFGAAPLIMKGIKDFTRDLDILVTDKLWQKLKLEYPVSIFENDGQSGEYIVLGNIEFVQCLLYFSTEECEDIIRRADVIEGYRFMNLTDMITWRERLGREKDFEAINLINEYLTKKSKVK